MMLDLAWPHEQHQWADRYAALLRDRLRWTIAHVLDHARQPDRLLDHIESFLHLIGQARDRAELWPLALDLIDALHPWPVRWGYGDRWRAEVLFACNATADQPWSYSKWLAELAHLLLLAGRLPDAVATSERALLLAREQAALVPWSIAAETRLTAAREQGQPDEARRLLAQLDADWPTLSVSADPAAHAMAQAHLGFQRVELLKAASQLVAARDECIRLIAMLEFPSVIDVELLAEAYSSLGMVLYQQLDHAAALTAIQRAIELRIESGDAAQEVTERGNLGIIYLGMADLNRAEVVLQQLVMMTEQMNLRLSMARAIGVLSLVYQMQGWPKEAIQHAERHVAVCLELGNANELARAQSNRADLLVSLGRFAEAIQDVEAGIALLEAQGRQAVLASSLLTWSYCLEGLGQVERAHAIAQRALDIGRQIQRPNVEMIALRHLSRYLPPDQQIETLHRALDLAQKLGRPLDAAGCLLTLAGLSLDEDERARQWSEGVQLLHQCGAIGWLDGHSPQNPPFVIAVL